MKQLGGWFWLLWNTWLDGWVVMKQLIGWFWLGWCKWLQGSGWDGSFAEWFWLLTNETKSVIGSAGMILFFKWFDGAVMVQYFLLSIWFYFSFAIWFQWVEGVIIYFIIFRAAEYVSGWGVHWYVDFLGLAVRIVIRIFICRHKTEKKLTRSRAPNVDCTCRGVSPLPGYSGTMADDLKIRAQVVKTHIRVQKT